MSTLEDRIETEVAAAMYLHTLRQAHKQLSEIRVGLKNVRRSLYDVGGEHHARRIDDAINNEVERSMWLIEQDIIARQKP